MFMERFDELKVPEKGTLRLAARVTGNPVPTVQWFRNNELLEPAQNVKQTYDGENILLEIIGADSEREAGDYKCVATNIAGKASHGARVTVDVDKVSFTKKLDKKYSVDEHNSVTLECETSHTVSTRWFHNGKELSGMDHREVIQVGRTHRIFIKRVKTTDEGTYQCAVKDQKTETTVTVQRKFLNNLILEFLL